MSQDSEIDTGPTEAEIIREQEELQKKKRLVDDEKFAVCVENLIKGNKSLLHLDMSNMGLSEMVLIRIVKALRTSESLLGLHLSGN